MARIVHSPAAEDDLLEIWVGLAAINESAAERLMDDLDAATRLLATQPLIGKSRSEFRTGIRSFPVRDYVIVYRPIPGGVELVRSGKTFSMHTPPNSDATSHESPCPR